MKLTELNVLIIDDVEMVRKSLSKCLGQLGITKVKATDSIIEAWSVINDENIDVIFCDWNMPKGDGIVLLEKLRGSEEEQHILQKFIMVTGSNDKVIVSMDNGANNVIHKPFNSNIIKEKLQLIYNTIFK